MIKCLSNQLNINSRDFFGGDHVKKVLIIACLIIMVFHSAAKTEERLQFSTVDGSDGLPLNVVEAGNPNGPEILLIHGAGQAYLAFKPQLESLLLTQKFRIVAFDLRGHGNSGKPWQADLVLPSKVWADDIAAVIKAKKLLKPTIIGWSFGGFIVMDYVRHYGTANIAGISLVSSLGGLIQSKDALPNFSSLKWQKLINNGKKGRSSDLEKNIESAYFFAHLESKNSLSEKDKQFQFAMGMQVPAYFKNLLINRNLDNSDIIQELTLPLLIITGSNDIIVPKEGTELLVKLLPICSSSIYENSDHMPFFDETERFNKEIAEFTIRLNQ